MKLKAGDLCLIIGCGVEVGKKFIGLSVVLTEIAPDADGYWWTNPPCFVGDSVMGWHPKRLMKISGFKETEELEQEQHA